MACCARLAPALLLHVNLLLCVLGGAALATAARLKWDPSTYVVVRELFPAEYRAAAAALAALGAAQLALAHLAAAALGSRAVLPRLARASLLTYAVVMVCLVATQVGLGAAGAARLARWLSSERAARVRDLLELRDLLRPLLAFLARYHPLPDHLSELMEEAEADAPRNAYAAAAALALAALLQLAAALLALVCAAAPPAPRRRRAPPADHYHSFSGASTDADDSERAPLRTAFRDGRLVIL